MTQYALYNPATHVAVPREPTEKMMVAALEARARNGSFKDMMSAMLAAAPPHVVELDSLRAELTAEVFKAIDCDMPCKNIRGCTCAMEGAQAILDLLGVK